MKKPFRNIGKLEAIFKTYFNPLVNLVYTNYVQDYEVAKEIVRSSMISIWKSEKHEEPDSALSGYILDLTNITALKFLEEKSEYERISSDPAEGPTFENFDFNSLLMTDKILNFDFLLKPKMKEIFDLYSLKKLSFAEISVLLNISQRAVESNILKAIGIIRDKLKDNKLFR